jgi:DNA polymerase-1
MYDHVKAAVAAGDVLLEWDGGESGAEPPPAPLLKDRFASERRKAKVLNFSIAYGKTAAGLARDWGVSIAEAEETLGAWYRDRPEVRAWQEATKEYAFKYGWVNTLVGRRRVRCCGRVVECGCTVAVFGCCCRASL